MGIHTKKIAGLAEEVASGLLEVSL